MKSRLWLRRVLLLIVPLMLAGGAWKARQLQEPIHLPWDAPPLQKSRDGSFGPKPGKEPTFEAFVSRVVKAVHEHPYASSIEISQSIPWPKESGLDLFMHTGLKWNRSDGTLSYSVDNYGWVYSHVDVVGLDILTQSHLGENPVALPPPVDAKLRARGWVLSEHYLP